VDPLDGLNPEQRRAAEAVRGPVCILAGAGSGKTTTITRRIAQQVASGAFPANAILAVTFTDKAAGELRSRLAALGAAGVRASTFHSAALRQLRHFAPERLGAILPSKVLLLRQIANRLGGAPLLGVQAVQGVHRATVPAPPADRCVFSGACLPEPLRCRCDAAL